MENRSSALLWYTRQILNCRYIRTSNLPKTVFLQFQRAVYIVLHQKKNLCLELNLQVYNYLLYECTVGLISEKKSAKKRPKFENLRKLRVNKLLEILNFLSSKQGNLGRKIQNISIMNFHYYFHFQSSRVCKMNTATDTAAMMERQLI